MGDPVENNLPGGRLGFLNSVELRIPIQEDVQFRDLGDMAAVDFPIDLNCELHNHTLPPMRNVEFVDRNPPRVFLPIHCLCIDSEIEGRVYVDRGRIDVQDALVLKGWVAACPLEMRAATRCMPDILPAAAQIDHQTTFSRCSLIASPRSSACRGATLRLIRSSSTLPLRCSDRPL